MKIAHLTSAHSPLDVRIFHKECRTLAAAGYEVVLLVPADRDEMVDGVQIRSLPAFKTRRQRLMSAMGAIFRRAVAEDADVYHFHDPELIPVGMLLKLQKKKVVYDVHEDLPKQILAKPWISPALRPAVSRVALCAELVGAWRFDRIVTATPSIAEHFPAEKTVTVQNFPIIEALSLCNPMPYEHRPPLLAYVGVMSEIRGIRQMVQSMEWVGSACARLALAGTFSPPQLEAALEAVPGWTHVDWLGQQSRAQVADLLDRARAGLVLFHPVPNHVEAYPNKLFEYMSVGIPVIASDFPLWREIISDAQCGLVVDPMEPRAIAEAARWILEHPLEAKAMGERGREAVQGRFNWDEQAKRLLGVYAELMA